MENTHAHALNSWKEYLSQADYDYLINYVENAKNNRPNNKLLVLLGEGGTGKSRLIKDITNYIGHENVILSGTTYCAFTKFSIHKLVHIPAINDFRKKEIQLLINVINYGQSIVADTNVLAIDSRLTKHIHIISMNHKFV